MFGIQNGSESMRLDNQAALITSIWTPNLHVRQCCHVCFNQAPHCLVTKPAHMVISASPSCSLCLILVIQIATCCVTNHLCLKSPVS